jgi:hypothetical protein
MKKLLALFICGVIILSFAGCKKDETQTEEVLFDINSATSAPAVTVPEGENAETSSDSNMGMDLVKTEDMYLPDISESYNRAAKIYADLKNFTFSYDVYLGSFEIKQNNSVGYYWRVNDERFDSVAKLEAYLDAYFTKDCQKSFYDPKRFIDHEGKLYASIGGVAESPNFAGYSFKLTKQTTKRICFTGTAYYYKSMEGVDTTQPIFTGVPKDVSKFDTANVEFEMLISDDGTSWKFSKFGYLG